MTESPMTLSRQAKELTRPLKRFSLNAALLAMTNGSHRGAHAALPAAVATAILANRSSINNAANISYVSWLVKPPRSINIQAA